jgi:Lon protease-like protein
MPWLPLFPLKVVLFPHMPLPLHVFEPRYRLMVGECLDEGHSFGVVAIREGGETGPPAIPHRVGTLAKLLKIERLEDGRMNLLVMGTSRFAIMETASDRPYLRGRVSVLPEEADEESAASLAEAVGAAFTEYSSLLRQLVGKESDPFVPPREPELLSYLVAAALDLQLPDKQALLEEGSALERLKAELRVLRKEIGFLRKMVRRKEAGLSRASLN